MVTAVVERGALATALPEALTAIELRMQAAATAITSNAFADLAGPDGSTRGRRARSIGAALLLLAAGGWYFLSGPSSRILRPARPAAHPWSGPLLVRPVQGTHGAGGASGTGAHRRR